MDTCYGTARRGYFTAVRYSREQLLIPGKIEDIMARGFDIYAMVNASREVRRVTKEELGWKVIAPEDLLQPLYQRDVDQLNSPAPLNPSGELDNDHLPVPSSRYIGEWDPKTNIPTLSDQTATSGDHYKVVNCPREFRVSLGGESIRVIDGDNIVHRDGKYRVDNSQCLSPAEVERLQHSRQNSSGAKFISPLHSVIVSKSAHRQIELITTPLKCPEFALTHPGGLSRISIHPTKGMLYVDPSADLPGVYHPKVSIGGVGVQLRDIEITVEIREG